MYDNIVSTQFTYADGNEERPSAPERSGSWLGRLARSDSSGTLNSVSFQRYLSLSLSTNVIHYIIIGQHG